MQPTASTVISGLAGGALVGLAASLLWLRSGQVAGVSGILAGVLPPGRPGLNWRTAFLVGLLAGGVVLALLVPERLQALPRPPALVIVAGLLVGFGTRLGGGCTSGHGICGVSRLSRRSIVATALFVATAMVTVAISRLAGMAP